MYNSIYTFDSVDISIDTSNQLIVVCDIDNTILYMNTFKTYAYYYKLLKHVFPYKSEELIYADASHLFYENKRKSYEQMPISTDIHGFKRLLERIQLEKGKIIYLTARNITSADITKKQFQEIGLIYDTNNTYYTNNTIHKGDYLNEILEIDNIQPIIFIDDLDENLMNMLHTYPNSKCYKFIYQPNEIHTPK